jgi:hypothetical protein
MLWPEYRGSIFEGVVASIGGISASLSERCTGALVCLLCQPSYMVAHATVCEDLSGVHYLVLSLLTILHSCSQEHWYMFIKTRRHSHIAT